MSEAVLGPARAGVGSVRRMLDQVTPHDRAIARQARIVAIFVGVVVVAYHYSFSTLLRTLKTDTPLAYLGLVPFIALALAAARARPVKPEPDIHDREVDYIIGVPLLLASLAINLLLPVRLSTMFWVWRVDLLALPLFVAGSIAVLFGVRTLWRLRFPVVFLLFAWPLPYTKLLMAQLQNFTNATLVAVKAALGVVSVASPAAASDGSLFNITHAGKTFQVSVASACSGVNGLVGYTLVTAAFLSIVKGRWFKKLAWLVLGLVTIWLLNVARILLIFWTGKQWGEAVAIDALHPYLGLVTFSLGVIVMLAVMKRFGLEVNLPAAKSSRSAAATGARTRVSDTGSPREAAADTRPQDALRRHPRGRAGPAERRRQREPPQLRPGVRLSGSAATGVVSRTPEPSRRLDGPSDRPVRLGQAVLRRRLEVVPLPVRV